MLPLFSDGDRLLVWHSSRPKRGDVIVFRDTRAPLHDGNRHTIIKRVTAVPGDTALCWDIPYLLDDTEYYVLGDNTAASTDSRTFGPIHRDRILGIVILKYFPTVNWVKAI